MGKYKNSPIHNMITDDLFDEIDRQCKEELIKAYNEFKKELEAVRAYKKKKEELNCKVSDYKWELRNVCKKYRGLYGSDIDRQWTENNGIYYRNNNKKFIAGIFDYKFESELAFNNKILTPTEYNNYENFHNDGYNVYIVFLKLNNMRKISGHTVVPFVKRINDDFDSCEKFYLDRSQYYKWLFSLRKNNG